MVPGFYWIVKAFGFLRSPVFRHSLRGTRAHPLLGISVLASSQKEGKLMAANVQKGVIPVRQLYNKMNQHNQHDNDMWWLTYKDKASNWGPYDVDIVASNYFRDGISAVPGNPLQMSLAGNTIQQSVGVQTTLVGITVSRMEYQSDSLVALFNMTVFNLTKQCIKAKSAKWIRRNWICQLEQGKTFLGRETSVKFPALETVIDSG